MEESQRRENKLYGYRETGRDIGVGGINREGKEGN